MSKNLSNKLRLLEILYYLKTQSSLFKPKNASDIQDYLFIKYDVNIERKTIYDDIKTINNFKEVIIKYQNKGFYFKHNLSISETKIVIDALDQCSFLSVEERNELIKKITEDTLLKDNTYLSKYRFPLRKKPSYKNTLDIINIITNAITNKQLLSLNDKIIFPFLLRMSKNHYYLLCAYYPDFKKLYNLRLDRIKLQFLSITDKPDFDYRDIKLNSYHLKHKLNYDFNMYSAHKVRVEIEILDNHTRILEVLENEFNNFVQTGENSCIIDGIDNSNFYGEMLKFSQSIRIKAPKTIKDKYLNFLSEIIKLHQDTKS